MMPDVPATRGVVCIVAPKFNGPLRASVRWRIAPTPPEWRPGGCGLLLFPHGGLQATSHPRHGVGSVLSGPVRPGRRFAQDGVYFGTSSLFLAKRIRRSGKRIRLVCVDTWAARDAEWLLLQRRQDREEANRLNGSVFLAFWHHVQERGLANIITPLMMASPEAASPSAPSTSSSSTQIIPTRWWLRTSGPGRLTCGTEACWPDTTMRRASPGSSWPSMSSVRGRSPPRRPPALVSIRNNWSLTLASMNHRGSWGASEIQRRRESSRIKTTDTLPEKETNFLALEGRLARFVGPGDEENVNGWAITTLGAWT